MDKRIVHEFLNFLRKNGHPLSESYEDSEEYALSIQDALEAIEFLKDNEIGILGGDILSEDKNGKLVYAFHLWNCYVDWECSHRPNETDKDYALRSYQIAKKEITAVSEIAKQWGDKCFVVIVF